MHHFTYQNDRLCAENVDLNVIAEEVGTPFYVYCAATLRRHFRVFADAFEGADPLVAFSVKANSNLAVLQVLKNEGAGADVVSGGELDRALRAGIPPERIVFSGVGKTRQEMRDALVAGIYQFNVESAPELEALNAIALDISTKAPIAFRVNPDVAAGGHEKISTGKREDKFGVAWGEAPALYAKAAAMPGIAVKGVDVHIGSQITELGPFERAFEKVASLIQSLREAGSEIDRLDLGGGLGIPYSEGVAPPHPVQYAQMIRRITDPLSVRLIFEPGRMIAGNAGALITRTIFVKPGQEKQFLIVDAGMNDLIRPALYDARHEIKPYKERSGALIDYDVVGPVCETSDRFAQTCALPQMEADDLIAIMSAGAYGAVQASSYNSRPLVPEVLVDGDKFAVIRRRPTHQEMFRLESVPDWLD